MFGRCGCRLAGIPPVYHQSTSKFFGESLPLSRSLLRCLRLPLLRGHPATPREPAPARQPLAERRTIAATGDHHSPKTCQAVVKTSPPLALSRPGDRQSPWMMLRTTELAPRRSNTSLPLRFDSVHGSPQGGTPRTSALSKVSPESDQLHRLPPAVRFWSAFPGR